jgi:hypothetical protein
MSDGMEHRGSSEPPVRSGSSEMSRIRYHPAVLEALLCHGIAPRPDTSPALVHEYVSDLYRFELRRLRARRVRGDIPRARYVDRVLELRARYPLLSLKLEFWANHQALPEADADAV